MNYVRYAVYQREIGVKDYQCTEQWFSRKEDALAHAEMLSNTSDKDKFAVTVVKVEEVRTIIYRDRKEEE